MLKPRFFKAEPKVSGQIFLTHDSSFIHEANYKYKNLSTIVSMAEYTNAVHCSEVPLHSCLVG